MRGVRWVFVVLLISAGGWAQPTQPGLPMNGEEGCPPSFTPLDGDACLSAPATPAASNGKVIAYFHGMMKSPWSSKSQYELVQLARAAVPRGYAVVALRGVQGLCDWGDDVKASWCWPNGLKQLPQVQTVIDRLREALEDATRRTQVKYKPPMVAGFSNGGFLVALLASDTRLAVSAYAICHGGPVIGQGFPLWRRRPMLLISANGDLAHFPRMKLLAQMLSEDRWEYAFTVREGVHEMTPEDMRALVEFFDRV